MNRFIPYLQLMRLHQPTGIWLLLWPCWWGAALASEGPPSAHLLALFALGAVLMRSVGCIINDLWDRDLDAQIERTKNRPLASGAVSVKQALFFMALLLVPAFGTMLALPPAARGLAIASLPLIVIYPLMKRITWWPQAFLGLTFNWGALMGWAAVRGTLEGPAFLLYAAGFFWTLGYDTVYAFQDARDDEKAGVKSTARRLGKTPRAALTVFYGVMLTLLSAAGYAAGLGPVFYLGLGGVALWLAWHILHFSPNDTSLCLRQFKAHSSIGALIFLAILLARFIR